MRPILRQQNTVFLAAFALLFSAESAWHSCEAQASTNRSSRIERFESYPDVVIASHDARDTNTAFYAVGIRSYLSQSEDKSPAGRPSRAERLTSVAIIDGHPHNPSKLSLRHLSRVV